LVFIAGNMQQPSEFNEMQTLLRQQIRRVGALVAADGDRQGGAEIIIEPNEDATAGTLRLAAGEIYIDGQVLPVPGRVIENVPLSGEISVGVRIKSEFITHEDDPSLLGVEEGEPSFNEAGAAREIRTLSWSLFESGEEGVYAQVYLVRGGAVLDQSPPPALTNVLSNMARYDFDANGHYVVDGCMVTHLGQDEGSQIFAISGGTANIAGWKRVRVGILRLGVPEEPDLEQIDLEPHTFVDEGGGVMNIAVARPAIAEVQALTVTKRITETVTRGAVPGGSDALGRSSVQSIERVEQNGSVFAPESYTRNGSNISWAPSGAEPAQASTYEVTYLYYDTVQPDSVSATHVTVSSDAVEGEPVTIKYTSKIPRIDIIGLDIEGRAVNIKGVSARRKGLAPNPPANILKLAEVHNNWVDAPTVVNNGTRNRTYDEIARYFELFLTMLRQFDRNALEGDVRESVSVSRDGIFTDTFQSDFYRDAGVPQTAAVNRGVLMLPVDLVATQETDGLLHMLDYIEEVIESQRIATRGMKINPYANVRTMPGLLTLNPPVHFWTETETQFTSPVTQEILVSADRPPNQLAVPQSLVQNVDERSVSATRLPQIDIDWRLEGFSANEELSRLWFGTVDITPEPPLVADLEGAIEGTLTIPALMPAGEQIVRAEGAAGSFAETSFVGEGTIEISVMQRVQLVSRAAPPPVNITNITNNTFVTNVTNVTNITQRINNGGGGGEAGGDGVDPLAQTFSLSQGRHLAGVNFKVHTVGNPDNGLRVQLCTTFNGYPTNEILADTFLSMQGVQADDVLQARFRAPVYLPPGVGFCFVIMTDDLDHALWIAQMGDVQADTQQLMGGQPYNVGVLFSSSNRLAWQPHNDADLYFELVAARFTETEKQVELWSGTLPEFSDLQVRGTIDLPTQATGQRYELVRENGDILPLAAGQSVEFSEYIDEPVVLRAVLTGDETVSPMLLPGTTLVAGRIRDEGTYVTKSWPVRGVEKAQAVFKQSLPAGSGITVEMDKGDGDWKPLSIVRTAPVGGGWQEPLYEIPGHNAPHGGRMRITLRGGPGARLAVAELRAFGI
jgi:hypothetical protein